jgi:hypothetical protein
MREYGSSEKPVDVFTNDERALFLALAGVVSGKVSKVVAMKRQLSPPSTATICESRVQPTQKRRRTLTVSLISDAEGRKLP